MRIKVVEVGSALGDWILVMLQNMLMYRWVKMIWLDYIWVLVANYLCEQQITNYPHNWTEPWSLKFLIFMLWSLTLSQLFVHDSSSGQAQWAIANGHDQITWFDLLLVEIICIILVPCTFFIWTILDQGDSLYFLTIPQQFWKVVCRLIIIKS